MRATLDDLELWNWSTALLCKVSHLVQFCMPTNINRYIDFQLFVFVLDLEIYIDLQLFILIFIRYITFQPHVLIFKKYVDFQMPTDVGRNILTLDSFCRYVVPPNCYSATTSDRKKGGNIQLQNNVLDHWIGFRWEFCYFVFVTWFLSIGCPSKNDVGNYVKCWKSFCFITNFMNKLVLRYFVKEIIFLLS